MSRVRDMTWPSRMPEDEWAEVAEGIPAKDEPFINKFLSGREALIVEEKKQRSGKYYPQSTSHPSLTSSRPCIPPIPLPTSQGSLFNRRSHPRRGAKDDMDQRVRRHSGTKGWREFISRDDVQSGERQDGENEVMADYQEDAERSFVACSYGCYGGL